MFAAEGQFLSALERNFLTLDLTFRQLVLSCSIVVGFCWPLGWSLRVTAWKVSSEVISTARLAPEYACDRLRYHRSSIALAPLCSSPAPSRISPATRDRSVRRPVCRFS
jgi:hypothetical protein